MQNPVNVLVTGAGGAAAVSIYKALEHELGVTCFMADIDPYAAGLYLVPPERRVLLPRGDHKAFVPCLLHACQNHGIDVLIPTVEVEMNALSQFRNLFEFDGTKVMMAPKETLKICLDKWNLIQAAQEVVPVPRTSLYDEHFQTEGWELPVVLKPRKGSGSNGIVIVKSDRDWAFAPKDGSYIAQAYLPGMEYSVDVLATPKGRVVAAVPRERLKVDSGIAVAARVRKDERLETFAAALASAVGLTFCANVQFKLDADGVPHLLEMNPRFPGTMPLTVAAGVNMPLLCLKSLYGYRIQSQDVAYREVSVMRYLQEVIVESGEVELLEQEKAYLSNPMRFTQQSLANL